MADVFDFETALEKKNAALNEVTGIRCDEDGTWIAEYQTMVFRGPSFDDLMLQLGWFGSVDFVDSEEVIEVVNS